MQLQSHDPDRGSQEQLGGGRLVELNWRQTAARREGEPFPPDPRAREPVGWRQASVVNES